MAELINFVSDDRYYLPDKNSIKMLDKLALEGRGELLFVIGGSLGLAKAVLERADLKLAFSRFTFPHQLMRVILLEQIYRWFKISRGEPYHK
ncbi:Ribosomal RNA large subunit methyltransferase H [Pelotomaculum schinkii]|uniref:Ribosomal RNA large subunit methyltransferase H n=1 Tax=Pelotomaculum schinkii TaxID=78350 RepID=A0A4Y7R634_9FIRM|nr:Ribosomal RNA large subunit methyltransferase H [Pelotomaculum schinkii]TEB17792.1 Ribosomal RNA large subunit methyltransferase H [Pelotomaculum sp. FP]